MKVNFCKFQNKLTKRAKNGSWKRKIGKSVVRRMLLWAHYEFRQKLLWVAKRHGTTVVIVNEAYTSKTCSSCGWQNHKLGKKKTFRCSNCDLDMDRDINAARNILLRNTCG